MTNFVPVIGFENYYGISESGEVISRHTGFVLKHGMSAGYPRVTLYKPGQRRGKCLHIHRLLAQHFIPNPDNLEQVNHIDGNRENFSLDNLEWCSAKDNQRHKIDVLGKTDNGWGTTRQKVDRLRTCEYCGGTFNYKKLAQRFCNNSCASKQPIKLFEEGLI